MVHTTEIILKIAAANSSMEDYITKHTDNVSASIFTKTHKLLALSKKYNNQAMAIESSTNNVTTMKKHALEAINNLLKSHELFFGDNLDAVLSVIELKILRDFFQFQELASTGIVSSVSEANNIVNTGSGVSSHCSPKTLCSKFFK
tara:strand:+ start:3396 stop:3833 length:438 start_codon:yes stop_codon:yes gene_type:complete